MSKSYDSDAGSAYDAWIRPRRQLAIRAVESDREGPVSKLGGDPCWLASPAWPLSRATGDPMMFVGQFRLPGDSVRLAYLFMSDDPSAATFVPEGGENAVVVQPDRGGLLGVATRVLPRGPALWRRGEQWDQRLPAFLEVDEVPMGGWADSLIDQAIEYGANEFEYAFPEHEPIIRSFVGGRPFTN